MEAATYVECPRDAWQALGRLIPTTVKRDHLRSLLAAGFRHLDLGSFVSPRAVPQLADGEEVLSALERPEDADFSCIIVNLRGLERAMAVPQVTSVGYPLAVNETFQRRNSNLSLAASWQLVAELFARALDAGLGFVVYLSMGFGNPYGDPWTPADTAQMLEHLLALGIGRVALADTVGRASAEVVDEVLAAAAQVTDPASLGLHLHARPDGWRELLKVGLAYGVTWFEGALAGVGGCPFAEDHLVGNLPTEEVLPWLEAQGFSSGVDLSQLPRLASASALLAMRFA